MLIHKDIYSSIWHIKKDTFTLTHMVMHRHIRTHTLYTRKDTFTHTHLHIYGTYTFTDTHMAHRHRKQAPSLSVHFFGDYPTTKFGTFIFNYPPILWYGI